MELQSLQEQLEKTQMDLLMEKSNGQQRDQDRVNQLEALEGNLLQQIMEEQNQQIHAEKVQEATESIGYILDTMQIEGLTIAELITDDDIYKLVRAGVQNAYVTQAEKNLQTINDQQAQHQTELKAITERVTVAEGKAEQLQTSNSELEVKNYQLTIENEDLNQKVTKGAELLAEANSQIEQQKTHIEELQTQIAIGVRGALNVIHVPQDTSKIAAEIIAKKVRITDVRYQDEHGIDRRFKTAVEVLTGKEITYEAIYEKRYIILNLEEAAQYRAEVEQKKAEIEAQNTVIPTLESVIEPVTEVEAPAEEKPFPEEAGHELGQGLSVDGEHVGNETPEKTQESEVVTLESLKAELEALKTAHDTTVVRVDNIEKHANIGLAVA